MKENLKIVFGVALFLVIIWGVFSSIQGKGFFEPTIEVIDELGNTISFLLKIIIFSGIVWFIISLFKKSK